MQYRELAFVALTAVSLSACEALDAVVDTTTGAAATVVDRACANGMGIAAVEVRKDLVDEINSKTTIGNHTPSDCDGDGASDFPIGPDGMVVRP